jgi:hypothetical protein
VALLSTRRAALSSRCPGAKATSQTASPEAYANKKIGADAGFRCVGRHKRREIKIEMGRDENEKVDG